MSLPDAFSATEVTLRGNGRWVRLEDYARTVGALRAQLEAAEEMIRGAEEISRIYFSIAAEAIGEGAVRAKRDNEIVQVASMRARAEAAEAECARLKSLARLDQALEQAAGELPDGWIVSVCAENGAGWVEMTDPEGERTHIDTDDSSLASDVLEAIEIARTKEQQA